ncbi:putative peptidoglycan-binding domain-containing protein [Cylindrospermum stagnale PCC 7417]|uniref:Putative peptidoglycan-binding domain-containing protein n=1 Tax=Cylindrospermum stagnale PCC 7417 TaxID=56107 RepID=K9WZ22_9NOST|nr:peptidoglycan-binding protein [Cylindrospermum stagnale]AFZ25600.1 putative peptidoglycan-binding domain-containing protein [Cylindrospermum stagnale PCC 7417]
MENLAYLHLAFAYEDSESSELISLSALFNTAAAPDWKRLSSRAWKYMLPLALTLSVLGAVSSALALERGDQGPSVRNLQQKLKSAGFYQAPVTQVYDFSTEDAVRRFQKAAGLPVDGIVQTTTLQKLDNWRTTPTTTPAKKTSTASPQINKTSTATTPAKKASTVSTQTNKISTANSSTRNRRNSNFLTKGDEGENIRVLQERLRIAGFYYGNATGIFGPITEEAVKRFQTAYKLDPDGVVGPATLNKLPPLGVGNGENAPKKAVNREKLRLGDRGEAVRVLQEHLIKAGYLEGQPNGYYGPYTADAVSRFQAANYLETNGVAGPTTRGKLYSLVKTTPKSEFNTLEIQRRLQERGFYKGPLNGMMADDTKKAIKQAQEFYGISLGDIRSGSY